jgi:hypothetical protein
MEQGDYDTIRALAEKYGDIVNGVDFTALLDEITEQESIVEFPFELTDFKVGGYTMLDATYEEVCATYGVKPNYDRDNPNYSSYEDGTLVDNEFGMMGSFFDPGMDGYAVIIPLQNGSSLRYSFNDEDYMMSTVELWNGPGEFDESVTKGKLEIPVSASSYEEWCQVMPIQKIKEKGTEEDQQDGTSWVFQTKYGNGWYSETKKGDGLFWASVLIPIADGGSFQIIGDTAYVGDGESITIIIER